MACVAATACASATTCVAATACASAIACASATTCVAATACASAAAANIKRKSACQKVGGEKKRNGHQSEKDFLLQYNPAELANPTEYGATSDTRIAETHPIAALLKERLGVPGLNVSNKSGNNIQIVLGKKIDEFENIENFANKEIVQQVFTKHLKKGDSKKPADLLVYKDDKNARFIFFKIDDIVYYIRDNCVWRTLPTGRVKGDFKDKSRKGQSQYITYEYRDTHKSYFLGLNGNKGKKFIDLLMEPDIGIKHYCDAFSFEANKL